MEFPLSTPFQNRLVGTVIVAAVAIIFLPDLLDGEKQTYQSDFESIPQAPAFKRNQQAKTFPSNELASLPKPQAVVDEVALDDEKQVANTATPSENNTNSDKVKVNTLTKAEAFADEAIESKVKPAEKKLTRQAQIKQALPEKAVPSQAWVIQLGSFKHKKNVDILVTKLKKNGYTAFTKPIKTKNGTLTKVFIGPELIKSSLQKKIPQLKALTNVEGKIARFYPTK